MLRRPLDPLTQDACAFYGDHGVFDDYTGVVLDVEEGKRIAARARRAQGGHPLEPRAADRRHDSVDEAAWWFITMERSCQAQLLAEAAGTPVHIDAEQAEKTAGQVGRPMAGWQSFQPLYDWIVAAPARPARGVASRGRGVYGTNSAVRRWNRQASPSRCRTSW